ncbi:type I toxin-antitoxin system Fst family toxin [Staphylococcus shinii]
MLMIFVHIIAPVISDCAVAYLLTGLVVNVINRRRR